MPSDPTPTDLTVSRQAATCQITWSDGRQHTVPLLVLRRQCPCATCNELRAQANPLQVLSGPPPSADLVSLETVGGYAIRFRWADGHAAGIYSYPYLRQLGDQS